MRMRKKKNRDARMNACAGYVISSPDDFPNPNRKELDVEIGCGKGRFICELALRNPDTDYIAIELSTDALINALELAKEKQIQNVRFMNVNAVRLCDFFEEKSVSKIYLNFSDPWPKARHAKRRLTYRSFLGIYQKLLKENGCLCVKTDNIGLFESTIEELSATGWKITNLTNDLHNSIYNQDNILTEYEVNFSSKGFNINRLEAYPPEIAD